MENTRRETDSLGEVVKVASEAYYGGQTMRAVRSFSISGIPANHLSYLIHALAVVRKTAVLTDARLGDISANKATAAACADIAADDLISELPIEFYKVAPERRVAPCARVVRSIARPMHSDETMEDGGTWRLGRLIWGSVDEITTRPQRPPDLDIMFTGYESGCNFESETRVGHGILFLTLVNSPQRPGIVAPHAGDGAAVPTKSTAQTAKWLALAVRSQEAAPSAPGGKSPCLGHLPTLSDLTRVSRANSRYLRAPQERPRTCSPSAFLELIWSKVTPPWAR